MEYRFKDSVNSQLNISCFVMNCMYKCNRNIILNYNINVKDVNLSAEHIVEH